MALVVDGVEIPIEVLPDAQSFAAANRALDETLKRGQKLIEQSDKRKKAQKEEADRVVAAERAKQKAIEETTKKINQQREKMEKLAQIGTQMAMLGAAAMAPFVASLNSYISNASEADKVAQRWKTSTDKIADAQARLGRETASVLNPALEKTADLVSKAMSSLEKNPAALSGLLSMGATLIAGGGAVAALATVSKQLATMSSLTGNVGMGKVAGGVGKLSEVALYATSVILAAETGLALGNAINKALGQDEQTWKDIFVTWLSLPAAMLKILGDGLAKIPLFGDTGKQLSDLAIDMRAFAERGADRILGPDAEPYQAPGEMKTKADDEARQKIIAEGMKAAEERAKIERDTQQKIMDAQKSYADKRASIEKSIADAARQFNQQESDAYQDYQNQRSDAIQQHNIENQRAEEDHQQRIAQIQRESRERIEGLVSQRDALGIVREKRAAAAKIGEENENYNKEKRRRNQDFQNKLREMDRNFQIEAQRRSREYEFMQQARQAELQSAQTVYQAMLQMLQQARQAALQATQSMNTPYAGVPTASGSGYGASSNPYATSAQRSGGGGSSSTSNVTVNGGGLSVSQTMQVVNQAIGNNNRDLMRAMGVAG